ncbi:hypothetical protein CK203_063035 [Vitis vinifera]|uniref:Uncharacterized protein n=1 Tax=Vitis vinifera TaxID=29760 RepID=A0A438G5J5_VITVI|nr:hypothetical protein CK203_063035 [Vitis vinifera]
MKTMGELQWARILVRGRGDARPSVLEVEAEEEVYAISLWWECRPVLRRSCRQADGRHSSEVRGEVISRAEKRVTKGEVRSPITRSWAQSGAMHPLSPTANPKESRGVGGPGLKSGVMGLKMKGVVASEISPEAGPSHRLDEVGCSTIGPKSPSNKGPNSKGCTQQSNIVVKLREGPSSSAAQDHNNSQKKDSLLTGFAPGNTHVPEPFVARETEDMRKLNGVARISETDKALEEESMRYGMGLCSWGKRVLGTSHLNSVNFDRTPGGEFFDHSGNWNEEARADNTMWVNGV